MVAGDLLDTLTNFFKEREQRVNGQHWTWTDDEAGVPQDWILGPFLFLIYINDLPENLVSNPKLFADDTSFFSVIRNRQLSAQNLNEDLTKINHWVFQWKMSSNPNPSKQAQEVMLSRKFQKLVFMLHFILITLQWLCQQPRSIQVCFCMLSWIFEGVSRTYTVKPAKQQVYYTSFIILYLDCIY